MPVDLLEQMNIDPEEVRAHFTQQKAKMPSIETPTEEDGLASRLGKSMLAGALTAGQGILNLPHNLTYKKPIEVRDKMGKLLFRDQRPSIPEVSNIDFYKKLLGRDPSLLESLMGGVAEFGPYGLIGKAGKVEAGATFLQKLLADLPHAMKSGMAYGFTQSEDPQVGALLGGPLGIAGSVLGNAASSGFKGVVKKPLERVANYVLDKMERGPSLNPEETAANAAKNYTTFKGERLPADIGTVANSPFAQKLYSALGYVPFSGIPEAKEAVSRGMTSSAIDATKDSLEKAVAGITSTSEQAGKKATLYDTKLQDRLSELEDTKNTINDTVNRVSSLSSNSNNPSELLRSAVRDAYQGVKAESEELYRPIRESNIDLGRGTSRSDFRNYFSAANEILKKKSNLLSIFGKEGASNNMAALFGGDSDFGAMVGSELGNAYGMMKNYDSTKIMFPEMLQRVQTLGKLASKAEAAGNRSDARMISKMQTGLKKDLNNVLNKLGLNSINDMLEEANAHYSENVAPFHSHPEINEAVRNMRYLSTKDSLAKAVTDPNFKKVFDLLPKEGKDAAIFNLLTKGKATSEGDLNINSKKLANSYMNLAQDFKNTIKDHNPELDSALEALPVHIKYQEALENVTKRLGDSVTKSKLKIKDPEKESAVIALKNKIENLENKKAGVGKSESEKGSVLEQLGKMAPIGAGVVAASTGLPGLLTAAVGGMAIPAVRRMGELLRSPEMLDAYIKGKKLNIEELGPLQEAIRKILDKTPKYMLVPNASSNTESKQ